MKNPDIQIIFDTLSWYANPSTYFGAPAPIYSDSGTKARIAIREAFVSKRDWWNDEHGLSLSDVNKLQERLGEHVFEGLIYTGGITTGTWLPWPGSEGNPIRAVLRLYANRSDWKQNG